MTLHLRATGCHLPYGITQCHLPPNTSEHTLPYPKPEAGTQFEYPSGMESWVDLGDQLLRWFTCTPRVTHLSTNPAVHGCKSNSWPADPRSDSPTTSLQPNHCHKNWHIDISRSNCWQIYRPWQTFLDQHQASSSSQDCSNNSSTCGLVRTRAWSLCATCDEWHSCWRCWAPCCSVYCGRPMSRSSSLTTQSVPSPLPRQLCHIHPSPVSQYYNSNYSNLHCSSSSSRCLLNSSHIS